MAGRSLLGELGFPWYAWPVFFLYRAVVLGILRLDRERLRKGLIDARRRRAIKGDDSLRDVSDQQLSDLVLGRTK